jgi:ferritin-like metal-binding protein YciE
MAKAAQSQELKAAFELHETETEEHVTRLEKVFKEIDETPSGKTCDARLWCIDTLTPSREVIVLEAR